MVAVRREPTLKRLAMVSSVQRKVSNGIAGSIPAEVLAYARAAYPQRRSSNANSLQSQNSAGFRQICAIFQIICVDISEFESYLPSHAVVSPGMRGVMSAPFGLARHLWADVARASIADAHSPPTLETMFATCDVRHRAPPSL
jgi:hypothetical protein